MCFDFVEVWADVQTLCLAGCYSLWQTEQCGTQSSNAFLLQLWTSIERWTRARYLDAIPGLGNAGSLKLSRISASGVEHSLSVEGLVGVDLQKDATSDVINVGFAHQYCLMLFDQYMKEVDGKDGVQYEYRRLSTLEI